MAPRIHSIAQNAMQNTAGRFVICRPTLDRWIHPADANRDCGRHFSVPPVHRVPAKGSMVPADTWDGGKRPRAAPGIWKWGVQSASEASRNFFCTPRFLFTGGYNWELNMENRVRFYCATHTLTATFKSSLVNVNSHNHDATTDSFTQCRFSFKKTLKCTSKRTPRHPRHHMTPSSSPYPILHFSRLVGGLSLMLKQRAEF